MGGGFVEAMNHGVTSGAFVLQWAVIPSVLVASHRWLTLPP